MKAPVTLIGAGNVGTHLGKRLRACGFSIVQVFSRELSKAQALAGELDAEAVNELSQVIAHEGLYLLAIRDDAIAEVAKSLSETGLHKGLFAHTSGATPAAVLQPYFERYGIFYPLQTFSTQRTPDFSEIPICIQAAGEADVALLTAIASEVGQKAVSITEKQRIGLHVAAVFVNNFSNYLYQTGESILKKEQLDFDLLLPLIRETAEKVRSLSPETAQTGPAIRGDEQTIARHLAYLQDEPTARRLYEMLTALIGQTRKA